MAKRSTTHRIPRTNTMNFNFVVAVVAVLFVCFAASSVVSADNATSSSSTTTNGGENEHVPDSHGGGNHTHGNGHEEGGHHRTKGLVVASWNYHEIRDPLIFTIVLVLTGICKIVYHHAGFLSSKIPESCILIILGLVFGCLIHFTGAKETLPTFFNPHEFFIFLLPPIILEAAFSLHDRTFIENLGSILLFAVVGTVLSCVVVGLSLFGLARAGAMGSIEELGFVELMVFSSLIVAVDPVAVLAVFNEIGVNHVLYFLVFGESLLNDGVTVVLYKVFQAYNVMDEITGVHIVLGIVKFFVVCVGGWFLGVLAGIGSALLTKHATHVKVAQPLIIYSMAYLGFLCAELFEFSGIISIIACGITQKHYAFNNISDKSRTTINYFTKVISTACETIIFMFLGLSLVDDNLEWHTGFSLWTILLCNLYRFIIIFGLSFLVNTLDSSRVRKISLDEQFMIAYGGLRGAVCFSLVALLSPYEFPAKKMFVTTTLFVVMFTVFIQGSTIKPLVYLFQIKLAPEKKKSMYKELHDHVTDHLMAGIEDIIGDHGKNHLREKMQYLDAQYLQPLLMVAPDPCDAQLKEFYEHLVLKEHYNHMKASNVKQMEQLPELPHITTELFLKGLLMPPAVEGSGPMERMPTVTVDDASSQGPRESFTTTDEAVPSDHEEEVMLRNRGGSRSPRSTRSPSHEKSPSRASTQRTVSVPSSPDVRSARELRVLLKQNTNSRIARYDRNLTFLQDFQTELRKKTDQNQRIRRLSTPDGLNPKLAAQLSWCEADSDRTAQRRKLSEGQAAGAGATGLSVAPHPHARHPHANTVDFQYQGRRATIDPVVFDGGEGGDSNNVAFTAPPLSSSYPQHPHHLSHLDSVHEENEEVAEKTGGSTTSDDDVDNNNDDENVPMIPGEGEEERRIRLLKRKGRRSTKHRLERQGGLDTPGEVKGQGRGQGQGHSADVPMKDLSKGSKDGGGGGGDAGDGSGAGSGSVNKDGLEVKVDIENGGGSGSSSGSSGSSGSSDDRRNGEDTSKV